MKVGVLIGRFQCPEPHEGHRMLIIEMLSTFDRVLILVGSANRAPSVRNPFSYQYRRDQIYKLFPQVEVMPLNDYKYSDTQWQVDVVDTVNSVTTKEDKITLCGHWKTGNDYLTWFPQWELVKIPSTIDISGTEIRNSFRKMLPKSVQLDLDYFENEAKLFSTYPYPDTLNFSCADSIVECNGHILLVERKQAPGAGTWALPGGFKNRNETFLECAIRELTEETNIRVPKKVLLGSVISSHLFDNPRRGDGIPRTTLATHYRIQPDNNGVLPRVSARDDAKRARWCLLRDVLNNYDLFDDHSDIISSMLNISPLPAYLNERFK